MTTFILTNFTILTTGNDGGHHYLSTHVNYQGHNRSLTVFFQNKADEMKLKDLLIVEVSGTLMDEGLQQSLLLLDSQINF